MPNESDRNYDEIENQQRELSRRTVEETMERIQQELELQRQVIQQELEHELIQQRTRIEVEAAIQLRRLRRQPIELEAERARIIQEALENFRLQGERMQEEANQNWIRTWERTIDKHWEREE